MTRFTSTPKHKRIIIRALAVAFWLAVWELASILVGQEILLVSPVRAVSALIQLMGSRAFYESTFNSFTRILIGFSAAAILGVALAALAFILSPVRALLDPVMYAIKATPVASFVILALVWIRSAHLSIFTGFLMVLPIMYTNILNGLLSADGKLIEMARVFRLSPAKQARAVYLPAAYPFFLSACELSLGMCWKAGIAAEVIGLPKKSIGEALYRSKIFLNTPDMFAWTLAIILLSVVFEKLALLAVRRTRRGLKGGGSDGYTA